MPDYSSRKPNGPKKSPYEHIFLAFTSLSTHFRDSDEFFYPLTAVLARVKKWESFFKNGAYPLAESYAGLKAAHCSKQTTNTTAGQPTKAVVNYL